MPVPAHDEVLRTKGTSASAQSSEGSSELSTQAITLEAGTSLERHLFHVKPSDPLSLAGTAGLVFVIAILACFVPALRAARIDAVDALRAE